MNRTAQHAHKDTPRWILPSGVVSAGLPMACAAGLALIIWTQATTLEADAKIVFIVTLFAVTGWVATRLPDSLVALLAALALVFLRAQPQSALTDTLGEPIVWLLLAAFVIAAVIKDAGLAERLVAPLTKGGPRVLPFLFMTGAAVSATAFLLPSTSGRAALLLPVFLGLLSMLPDPRLAKPLALLFPTAILLSAGGSLIGAGAHVVAVEAIAATGGPRISYLDWLMIGAPLAFVSVFLATLLIFALFVPRELRNARLSPSVQGSRLTAVQRRILLVLVGLIALWITKPLHGLNEPIVALSGAVLLLFPPFCTRKPKDIFRAVDVELVLYMAATLMLAVAVIDTGLDRWLANAALAMLPAELASNGLAVIVFLSVVAVASHLAITSRSARAGILIPALALPVAGLGHDATLAILIAVMGTGFCQTMMVSAKPVAIFGAQEEAGFTQKDLFRLAVPLAPVKVALLVAFAVWIWPHQVAMLDPAQAASHGSARQAPQQIAERNDTAATVVASGIAVSLRPQARPESSSSFPETRAASRRSAVASAQPAGISQSRPNLARVRTDLRIARSQLQRDLSRLFR
ncbi:anion permease [Tateyamaria omphalii]|uniref:SLC13 family permease n=1 Tax=Tateyamaria omphalii TaxID=299262 RepID=UPI001C9A098F|nr:SLC13 family permease [Tateyamaria omphalii]MBY5935070.1 anion permease [Tateyamaria omphalii]